MNKRYQDILDNLQERPPKRKNDHILIIDSLNTFIRGFTMIKTMNPKGQHIGGLLGFLRSLGYLVRTQEPTRVICVFDGKGSSINRKNIDPNYKSNRDNLKVTHWGLFDSREEERESMGAQISRLFDYLDCLPLSTITMDKVEADDMISYIAQEFSKNNSKVTVVSSDKDFLQIIDKNINVYAPIKKKLYTYSNIQEELKVLPENYLVVKSLIGDHSDNLRGVKGAGVSTLVNLFPNLNKTEVDLDYIYSVCEQRLNDRKLFSKIVYDWEQVQRNYELMNLKIPRLTIEEKNVILKELKKETTKLQSGTFLHYLEQDSIEGITKNTDTWIEQFRPLTIFK